MWYDLFMAEVFRGESWVAVLAAESVSEGNLIAANGAMSQSVEKQRLPQSLSRGESLSEKKVILPEMKG